MLRRILATVGAALLAAGLASSPHSANAAPDTYVQPGEYLDVEGIGCTMSFIFDGVGAAARNVYVSTAAHCVTQVGAPAAFWDGEVFGTVAMLGSPDDDLTDWAFIKVAPSHVGRVRAGMLGHPSYPTGVARSSSGELRAGDQVQVSGNASGMDLVNVTREQRRGVLVFADAQRAGIAGPVWWGDSGGPLVHIRTGKALGIVSRMCVFEVCSEVGPTVEGAMAAAAARGLNLQLRTA